MKQQIKVVPSGNRGCPRKQTHPGEGSFWDLDLSCYSPPLELSSWGTTDLLRVYFEMMFSLVQRRLGNDLSPQSWPTHHSSWSPPHRLSSLPLRTSSSPSTPNVLSFSLPRQAVVPSVLISHTRPIPSVFLSLPPFTPVTADQLLPLWEKGSCEHIKSLPVADPLPSGATLTPGPIGPEIMPPLFPLWVLALWVPSRTPVCLLLYPQPTLLFLILVLVWWITSS